MIAPDILLVASVALFLAATVKGFVGMGLPTVALALMTLSLDPRTAISLILVPMLMSNLWQTLRGDDLRAVIAKYWRFAAILFVTVGLSVWLTQSTSDRVLLLTLGVIIVIFTGLSWRKLIPVVPAGYERPFEAFCAFVTGAIGGMTAAWAAPVAIFLSAKRVPPDEFVQATGFLITVGSVPLLVSYVAVGHTEMGSVAASAILLIPTLLGFSIGEALRKRADPELFRRIFLLVFLGLGLNLLYRAATGG